MCLDFMDLDKASPKDDFPLAHIDGLVDNTTGNVLLSFMNVYAGYTQIKMIEEDMEKTSIITPWGTYCYIVMLFGLQNAKGNTSENSDMMHNKAELYVDDMITKPKKGAGHAPPLRKLFMRLRKYNMRLNPQKCAFGVTFS